MALSARDEEILETVTEYVFNAADEMYNAVLNIQEASNDLDIIGDVNTKKGREAIKKFNEANTALDIHNREFKQYSAIINQLNTKSVFWVGDI